MARESRRLENEHRIAPRTAVRLPCRVSVATRSKLLNRLRRVQLEAHLTDLSVGGACIAVSSDAPEGSLQVGRRIEVEISQWNAVAIIRHLSEHYEIIQIGAEFIDSPAELDHYLYQTIDLAQGDSGALLWHWQHSS